MKKLLVFLVALGSLSIYAETEFEQGFIAGAGHCSTDYISCEVVGPDFYVPEILQVAVGGGLSKGEALRDLVIAGCSESDIDTEICRRLVKSGKARCRKL